jgi:hypothetical protein
MKFAPVSVSFTFVPINALVTLSDVNPGIGVAVGAGDGDGVGVTSGKTLGLPPCPPMQPLIANVSANMKSRARGERISPR